MKVLVINPGATSTKVSVFEEEQQLFKVGIDHSAEELDRFAHVIDQAEYRKAAILNAVAAAGYDMRVEPEDAAEAGTVSRTIAARTEKNADILFLILLSSN